MVEAGSTLTREEVVNKKKRDRNERMGFVMIDAGKAANGGTGRKQISVCVWLVM